MDTLEGAVSGGGYVAGDRFTAADVYVGSHIGWGLQMQSIEKRAAFEDYWARLCDPRRLAEGRRAGRRPPGRAQVGTRRIARNPAGPAGPWPTSAHPRPG